jgi:hypothetical protein
VLVQYWLPDQLAERLAGRRRTVTTAGRLFCAALVHGETLTADELHEAGSFAFNVWCWLGAVGLGAGMVVAALVHGLVPASNPLQATPFLLGGLGTVALAQLPALQYRYLRIRRAAARDAPLPVPKAADFWVAATAGAILAGVFTAGGPTATPVSGVGGTGARWPIAIRITAGLSIVIGLAIAGWAVRRRPPNWTQMTWRAVIKTPGTREGLVVLGILLILAGGITIGVLRMLSN